MPQESKVVAHLFAHSEVLEACFQKSATKWSLLLQIYREEKRGHQLHTLLLFLLLKCSFVHSNSFFFCLVYFCPMFHVKSKM